jgi:phosphate transport system permease protein
MSAVTHAKEHMVPRPTGERHLARRFAAQRVAWGLLWASGLVTIGLLLLVVGYTFSQGLPALNLALLTAPPRGGINGDGGISTTVLTTLYLIVLTVGIATPLGVGAAVYLVEYAGEAVSQSKLLAIVVRISRIGVETLAGVPSIIFGLFGYALFVLALHFGASLLSAGLAGACLILPTIIRATEEALRAVPRSYREGSLALGTTRWYTIWHVVLPAALPGIATSVVLSISRVISETAVFYVTLGNISSLPKSLLSGGRTIALQLYYLATETRAFQKAMATGAILIVLIMLINLVINFLSRRFTARS